MYDDYPVNKVEFEYSDLEEAFPSIDCQHAPCGPFVVVQIRTPKTVTKGGIILSDDSKAVEQDNTQVAKVIAIGPQAFRDKFTGEEWAGGAWYAVGDFVRAPKYGGDRWNVKAQRKEGEKKVGKIVIPAKTTDCEAQFAMFRDTDIRMKVRGDPRRIKSFL